MSSPYLIPIDGCLGGAEITGDRSQNKGLGLVFSGCVGFWGDLGDVGAICR